MTPIVTITLNPAIDVSASVTNVVPNEKLRCTGSSLDPGGGGVNVSRAIAILGGVSTAFVATAGATGRLLGELLANEGLNPVVFEATGQTRQNFAVTEVSSGNQFRFTLPGPDWSMALIEKAISRIAAIVPQDALVVLSGSLPPGAPDDLPTRLAARLALKSARLILDTSGSALLSAVSGGPFHILRMDRAEAVSLAGRPIDTPGDLASFARGLIGTGAADAIIMALGAAGNIVATRTDTFHCTPPKVSVVSSVGAGDSFVAGLTLALAQGTDLRSAASLGTAAAASAVTTPATRLCERAGTESLLPRVTCATLET